MKYCIEIRWRQRVAIVTSYDEEYPRDKRQQFLFVIAVSQETDDFPNEQDQQTDQREQCGTSHGSCNDKSRM